MLDKSFEQLYLLFRANYYKRMVQEIGTREGSLSATELFCVEIIYLLQQPTISAFANFLGISVPNANYKINSLEEKGYVRRHAGTTDKREFYLHVTPKFLDYYGLNNQENARLMRQIHESFTAEEVEELDKTIQRIILLMQNDIQEEPT